MFFHRYAKENVPLVAIVGKDYGSGSSRDWAAKGPFLLVNIFYLFNRYNSDLNSK